MALLANGKEEDCPGDWKVLGSCLHYLHMKGGRAGIAHLVLFWGSLISFAVFLFAQFPFALPPEFAGALSLFLDLRVRRR